MCPVLTNTHLIGITGGIQWIKICNCEPLEHDVDALEVVISLIIYIVP
jgi:hypothetical protein